MRTGSGIADVQIPFTFDGKSYVGLAGDTLAAALIANGVTVIARSFKYHRPPAPDSFCRRT